MKPPFPCASSKEREVLSQAEYHRPHRPEADPVPSMETCLVLLSPGCRCSHLPYPLNSKAATQSQTQGQILTSRFLKKSFRTS